MAVYNYAPSVSRALPPVGWQSTLAHEPQRTTVCACEKTVVMAKHPEEDNMLSSGPILFGYLRTGTFDVHEERVW
jgi:hypothetical protein